MDKNQVALTPPMGWNSWDCFGASVNEEQLLANARYMQQHLKPFGWEYVVCDIQWSEPTADSTEYHPFAPLCMDEYSRLMPAPNRFPSAAGGKGFAVIAEQIHGMGLKFGIHIMRGIPRQAVHANTAILGSDERAREVAHPYSVCPWNSDMYGLNPQKSGAQAYYDSIFQMYAQWGVDFVKVDDIANTEFRKDMPYSAEREIEMIRLAIDRSGREMVLSLSPGPAVIEKAWHLSQNANMWRMTGDFWDHWPSLEAMFERCEVWAAHVQPGCWPDCDMLPVGKLRCFNGGGEMTRFTKDEQITMMTLWCMFGSPLMIGGHLPETDEWTLKLLTNQEVLWLLGNSFGARQVERDKHHAIWTSWDEHGGANLALFNLAEEAAVIGIDAEKIGLDGELDVKNLWSGEVTKEALRIEREVPKHGAVLLKVSDE